MFGKIFKGLRDGARELGREIDRALNQEEMERIAAVVAMMAFLPDGNADDDEIEAGVNALKHQLGNLYKPSEMIGEVRKRVEVLKASPRFGKLELMSEIEKATDESDMTEAEFLVQVAAAIGEAPDPSLDKGVDPFTPAERALAREIALRLGVDPKTANI